MTKKIFNVEVDFTEDLIAMYAKNKGANYLIRGLRSVVDYSAEEDLADKNERLSGLDTIFLRAGRNGYISSTYVMELFKRGYDIKDLVSTPVYRVMQYH
jgi:pantetheine-phosphate adenylyltransferase